MSCLSPILSPNQSDQSLNESGESEESEEPEEPEEKSINIRAHKGPQRLYTEGEISIIRMVYPVLGLKGCAQQLPDRTLASIRGVVERLQLKRMGRKDRMVLKTTAHIDKQIIDVYRNGKWGSIKRLSKKIDRPYHWIRLRALHLGVRSVVKWDRYWSEEEDNLLRELSGHHLITIRRKMMAAGFKRSESAIQERIYRLGCDTSNPDLFTANEVARMLGSDTMHVLRWIRVGALKSSRDRHMVTDKVIEREERGPGKHWITYKDLRAFMIGYPTEWHCRKVRDSVWLVSILAGKVGLREQRISESAYDDSEDGGDGKGGGDGGNEDGNHGGAQ